MFPRSVYGITTPPIAFNAQQTRSSCSSTRGSFSRGGRSGGHGCDRCTPISSCAEKTDIMPLNAQIFLLLQIAAL